MDVYVLSLLHFNVQYCAGGIAELITDPAYPSDDASVQDAIVVESFEPVLAMLERHPDWKMDLELQAYMIEVLAERHPAVLDRLRVLADAGQVELVSFHYSDQLWLAFPWRDQERSLQLVQEVFAAHDLPLSDVVFTQEGQFGEGMLQRMPEYGYRTAVLPKNLARELWGAESSRATWRYDDDVQVLVGGSSYQGDTWRVDWHFLNDGELYATDEMNCYLGAAFVHDPEEVARREAELQALQDAGARLRTIGEFMAEVGAAAATEPLPAVVDGTWQPDDTGNLHLWMGGLGLFAGDEDNVVRTGNVRARHRLAAAEQVEGADPTQLELGWRAALLGQVSDATGWNPLDSEVAYGKAWTATAEQHAEAAIAAPCAERGATWLRVDVATGQLLADGEAEDFAPEPVEAPFVVQLPERPGVVTWTDTPDADVLALTVAVEAGEAPVSVVFPWDAQVIATIPALSEQVRTIAATDIAMDPIGLPLSSGLIRLQEGVWLVEDTRSVHLAALMSGASGTVSFVDEGLPLDARELAFRVVLGDEARATEVALALNVRPTVELTCPPEMSAELPCGCGSGGQGAGVLALGAAAAAAAARRRRG